MNQRLAGALRNAFEDLAESGPPPAEMARTALVAARRQRLTRWSTGSGIATAVCATLVGVVTLAPIGTKDELIGGGLKPLVVTAYTGIPDGKAPFDAHSLLLDPRTGRYDELPYRYAMPSPDGSRVLVATGGSSTKVPARWGVMDRASGDIGWIDTSSVGADVLDSVDVMAGDGYWSPDGRRILLTSIARQGAEPGFVLADPENLTATFVPLPDLAAEQGKPVNVVWAPNSEGVVLNLTQFSAQNPQEVGIELRFYDLAGELIRTVPTNGGLLARRGFSPDGKQVALFSEINGQTFITVADSITGAVRHAVPAPDGPSVVGWADNQHLLIQVSPHESQYPQSSPPAYARVRSQSRLLVVDLNGRVSRSAPLPFENFLHFFVGPSTGLPLDAANNTF